EFSKYSSPVQNDLYTSLVYKKHWFQPGIAIGYSEGNSREALHLDTTVNGHAFHLYDSTTNNLKAFTTIFSVQHGFGWTDLFKKGDSISVTPVVMLNVGTATTSIKDNDNFNTLTMYLTPLQAKVVQN